MTEVITAPLATGETDTHFITFRQQLSDAMRHAASYEDAAVAATTELVTATRYNSLLDEDVIDSTFKPEPAVVATTDPEAFRILLAEAFCLTWEVQQSLDGEDDLGPMSLEDILASEEFQEDYDHELRHAEEGWKFGNGKLDVSYAVRLTFSKVDGRWAYGFVPFVGFNGPMRKAHRAWVSLAPAKPSLPDRAYVRGLGYDPDDKEGLRKLAESVPPVGESWVPRSSLRTPASALTEVLLIQWDIRKRRQR